MKMNKNDQKSDFITLATVTGYTVINKSEISHIRKIEYYVFIYLRNGVYFEYDFSNQHDYDMAVNEFFDYICDEIGVMQKTNNKKRLPYQNIKLLPGRKKDENISY